MTMLTSRPARLLLVLLVVTCACRKPTVVDAASPLDAGAPQALMEVERMRLEQVRPRFVEILRALDFPLSCEDGPREGELRAVRSWERVAASFEVVRIFREATMPGEQGEGCCPPCLAPCSESGCSYCAPADQCVEYAFRHQVVVTFRLESGEVRSETVERYTSPSEKVIRVPYVPPVRARNDLRSPVAPGPALFGPPPPNPIQRALAAATPAPPRPEVSMEPPTVGGSEVDREKLSAFFIVRKSELAACYAPELRRTSSLKGRLVVHFNLTPSGLASDVRIKEDTLRSEPVASCVRDVVRGWLFSFTLKRDVAVAFPLGFSPAR